MTLRPWNTNSAASGFREAVHAALVGSTRPGLRLSVAVPSAPVETATASVEPPAGPAARLTRAGSYRNAERMFPPGSPPSWPSTGLIWIHS